MKYCFIDTETSGTDPARNGLLQIAGKIVIDGKVVERFDLKCAPFPEDEIDPKALEVNRLTEETIRTFPEPHTVYRQFVEILSKYCDKYKRDDKYQFVGWNADFDANFIRSWFHKNGDAYFGSWFFVPIIDVSKLAAIRLIEQRPNLINFRLMTVAHWFRLPIDDAKAHDAMYDIEITMMLFELLTKDMAFVKVKMEI